MGDKKATMNVDIAIDLARSHDPTASELQIHQRISQLFGMQVSLDYISERFGKVDRWRKQISHLQTIPVVVQRSPEWYARRNGLLTASDAGQAMGVGKFGSPTELMKKKCQYEPPEFNETAPPLKWGTMYEPVANDLYERLHNTKVHEFGLLPHPTKDWFGASPDGINEHGVMLEIKTPYRRAIVDGKIMRQYHIQVLGQMEVCGLDECDFFECEIANYGTYENGMNDKGRGNLAFAAERFMDDSHPSDPSVTLTGRPKGAVLEAEQDHSPIYKYKYSPWGLPAADVVRWIAQTQAEDPSYATVHYWFIKNFLVQRVYREQPEIENLLSEVHTFWQSVLACRSDRSEYDQFLKRNGKKQRVSTYVRKTPAPAVDYRAPAALDQYAFDDDE